ncbi:MAG: hypothetical protein GF329_16325 [Candidatus Lokiarchaeota archaeon]|nr:hypothetical protein [Candidatus Lokiarchaeota archaeon]MBD3341727.1 hypothetical protein [Candidatus Lokiarchaeota archaeon]
MKKYQKLTLILSLFIIQLALSNHFYNNNFYSEKESINEIDYAGLNSNGLNNKKNWTILIYMDADNNLESYAIQDFLELSYIGSNENFSILVQFDRIASYSEKYDNWTTTKRFYVSQGMTPNSENALMDLGELNMGDPQTLSDFISWGVNLYPAEHYALILWDHGNGWKSLCSDTTNDDYLSIDELGLALQDPGHHFDLIGFDACQMAMMSVTVQIKNWADYCVASENTEPGNGWPYHTIFQDLKNNPAMRPDLFGEVIVDRYIEEESSDTIYYPSATLSVINLTNCFSLISALNDFSNLLIQEFNNIFDQIHLARLQCEDIYTSGQYADLLFFAEQIRNNVLIPELQNAANNVIDNVSSLILKNGVLDPKSKLNGLGIYFPVVNYNSDYNNILLSELTEWDSFIGTYYYAQEGGIDDNCEENDSYSNAKNIALNEGEWLSSIYGALYLRDNDWYRIFVSSGEENLTLKLNYSHPIEPIYVDVYSNNNDFIISSGSTTKSVNLTVLLISGYYLIRVHGNYGGNTYDLWWNDEIPDADDNYEENDIRENAYYLERVSYEKSLSSIDGIGIQSDDDWFHLNFSARSKSRRFELEIIFNHERGNIDLDLYNSSGTLIYQSNSTNDNEYIKFSLFDDNHYYIRIYGDNSSNTYDILHNFEEDDIFENNNEYTNAYNLTKYKSNWFSYYDALLTQYRYVDETWGYQWDNDWYEIYVEPDKNRLIVDLSIEYSDYRFLTVRVCNLTNNEINMIAIHSGMSTAQIDCELETPGTYYILVDGGDRGARYDLRWGGYTPNDDRYEENDNQINAYNISTYEQKWISEIGDYGVLSDDDWYEIYVGEGEEFLNAKLFYMMNGISSNIYITVYNENLELITTESTNWDMEQRTWFYYLIEQNLSSYGYGKYYLKINGTNNNYVYDLWWDCVPINDDNYEENDEKSQSYDLSGHESKWISDINGLATSFSEDADWYKIRVDYGEEILQINVSYSCYYSPVRFYIYDKNMIEIKESIFMGYNSQTKIKILVPPGIYFIKIEGYSEGVEYDLWWDDQNLLTDDIYEENDDVDSAYYLESYRFPSGDNRYGIQNDDDWYVLNFSSYQESIFLTDFQLVFNNTFGNVSIEVYNSSLELIGFNYSSSGNKTIKDLYLQDKCYIKISGDNSSSIYDLIIDYKHEDDKYEHNDVCLSAFNISDLEDISETPSKYIKCFQCDNDWFKFNVSLDKRYLNLGVFYSSYNEPIDLYIFNENLNLVTNLTIKKSFQDFYISLPSAGLYYLNFNGSNMGDYYKFYWRTLLNPVDDSYEENDDWNFAFNLTSYRRTWLSSVNGLGVFLDNDWYEVSVESEEQLLNIKLTYLFTRGELNLAVFNSTDHLIIKNESPGNKNITAILSKGTYYINIYGISNGLRYDIWWDDVVNDSPILANITPNDGAYCITDYIILNIKLIDPDNDFLNLFIYNGMDNRLLNSYYNVQSNSFISYNWTNLETEKTYHWYIIVNDGISLTKSDIKSFTTRNPVENDNSGDGDDDKKENESLGTANLFILPTLVLLAIIISVGGFLSSYVIVKKRKMNNRMNQEKFSKIKGNKGFKRKLSKIDSKLKNKKYHSSNAPKVDLTEIENQELESKEQGLGNARTEELSSKIKRNKELKKNPRKNDLKLKNKKYHSLSAPIEDLSEVENQELEKTEEELEIEKKKIICVVHRGIITGSIYVCPYCGTFYCSKCAKTLKEKEERCWSCDRQFEI